MTTCTSSVCGCKHLWRICSQSSLCSAHQLEGELIGIERGDRQAWEQIVFLRELVVDLAAGRHIIVVTVNAAAVQRAPLRTNNDLLVWNASGTKQATPGRPTLSTMSRTHGAHTHAKITVFVLLVSDQNPPRTGRYHGWSAFCSLRVPPSTCCCLNRTPAVFIAGFRVQSQNIHTQDEQ